PALAVAAPAEPVPEPPAIDPPTQAVPQSLGAPAETPPAEVTAATSDTAPRTPPASRGREGVRFSGLGAFVVFLVGI
ncbi:hypothetical protein ABTE27_24680, partial [Acinetobacter baumannii]